MEDKYLIHACCQFWFKYDCESRILQRYAYGNNNPPVECHPAHLPRGLRLTAKPLFGMCGYGPGNGNVAITEDLLWLIDLDNLCLTRIQDLTGVRNDETLTAVAINVTLTRAVASSKESGAVYLTDLHTGICKRLRHSSQSSSQRIEFLDILGDRLLISTPGEIYVYSISTNAELKRVVSGGVQDCSACLHTNRIHVLTHGGTIGQKVCTYSANLDILTCQDIEAEYGNQSKYFDTICRLTESQGQGAAPFIVKHGPCSKGDSVVIVSATSDNLYTLDADTCMRLGSAYDQLWNFGRTWVGKGRRTANITVIPT